MKNSPMGRFGDSVKARAELLNRNFILKSLTFSLIGLCLVVSPDVS